MLELTRSGELLGDEYRADEPLRGPSRDFVRDCLISSLGVAPSR